MSRQVPRHIPTIVGLNLRAARLAKGLTQREVAKALDTDAFQVSRWEKGRHRPGDETLFALAELLERDFASFFSEPELAA